MAENRHDHDREYEEKEFTREIGNKEDRKLRARNERRNSIWFWMGMFGMVGWAVMIPTLIFIAIGIWIDKTFSSRYSWTLMLLIIGILTGCLNAWYWIKKEMGNRR